MAMSDRWPGLRLSSLSADRAGLARSFVIKFEARVRRVHHNPVIGSYRMYCGPMWPLRHERSAEANLYDLSDKCELS